MQLTLFCTPYPLPMCPCGETATNKDKDQKHCLKKNCQCRVAFIKKRGKPSILARISSNFFTVPLKKGSQSAKVYFYPNRPVPVLKLGQVATGITWGISYFEDWIKNLPELLVDVKSSSPFTDLAVFVLKDFNFDSKIHLSKFD